MPLLSLNREQLAQFDRSVTLHKIEKLRLEEDVEREDVRKHIRGFEKISALEVPERLYPWILTLCHKCGSVVAY
jgi:hypothetical protein